MLANAPVTTILPVINMARAREFYESKLGLAISSAFTKTLSRE